MGTDAIVGVVGNGTLSFSLIYELHKRNIWVLPQLKNNDILCSEYWLLASQLCLPTRFVNEWNNFTSSLSQAVILLDDKGDIIVWDQNVKNGEASAKLECSSGEQ